jgi:hypothetical protein
LPAVVVFRLCDLADFPAGSSRRGIAIPEALKGPN